MMEMWLIFIVGLATVAGNIAVSAIAHKKSSAIMEYRLNQLENKVDLHNSVIERTYKLEQGQALIDAELKRVNHRLDDLESE